MDIISQLLEMKLWGTDIWCIFSGVKSRMKKTYTIYFRETSLYGIYSDIYHSKQRFSQISVLYTIGSNQDWLL